MNSTVSLFFLGCGVLIALWPMTIYVSCDVTSSARVTHHKLSAYVFQIVYVQVLSVRIYVLVYCGVRSSASSLSYTK